MFALPSKEVPPIVLAFAKAVAVADSATAILQGGTATTSIKGVIDDMKPTG